MTQVCSKCSRVNPPDAAYCYYDGAILAGHTANGGPINQGSAPFPSQFVFPSGLVCRNFDQLALACQQNWRAAVDLLKQGFLTSFLGGLGRADLALAAQEAARFPDQDRGLDQFLAKLPTQVLETPKLKAEPSEVNLGQVPLGSDRQFDLHLINLGMRLVFGSVVSDCKWLALGEAPGSPQKLFQFGGETTVAVHVRGQHLRAGTKPLPGRLVVESNGGTVTVPVRADVPVKPFAEGVLAGSVSPRQIAQKAKKFPKDAAVLFEKGAVADWFTLNGWKYPVQGPSASGLGAVQQFFEALGLAKAPKVEVSVQAVNFRGKVGDSAQTVLEVKTPESKYVYAHATCDQSWLEVGRAKLNGRFASITVKVASVPNQPGETLKANLNVSGNGNQRFVIPVTLAIDGTSPFADLMAEPAGGVGAVPLPAAATGPQHVVSTTAVAAAGTEVAAAAPAPSAPASALPTPAAFPRLAPPGIIAAPTSLAGSSPTAVVAPMPRSPEARTRSQRQGMPMWLHLVPLGVLAIALVAVMLRDRLASPSGTALDGNEDLRIGLYFDFGLSKEDIAKRGIEPAMSFGLVKIDDAADRDSFKKLTYDEWGANNSTVVRIDGNIDRPFGQKISGAWEVKPKKIARGLGMTGSWMFLDKVQVTQTARIVPGEMVEVGPGAFKRFLDTCFVRYKIENKDKRAHKVGLRVLLDTYIGDNDGPFFTVPGLPDLVKTKKDFSPPQRVPDFVQALENPEVKKPGIVVQFNFRLSDALEAPSRISLTHWPGPGLKNIHVYNLPMADINNDSAVVMYWEEKEMRPGAARTLGFTVGLGAVSTTEGLIGLSVGGSTAPGGQMTVVALVADPQPKQTITLELPPELSFVDKESAKQEVPTAERSPDGRARPSPVTWRVRSTVPGTFTLEVKTSTGRQQKSKVHIRPGALF